MNNTFSGSCIDALGNGVGGLSVVITVFDLSQNSVNNLGTYDCITSPDGSYSFPGVIPGMGGGDGAIQILVWTPDGTYQTLYTQWAWVAGSDAVDNIVVTPTRVDG